MLGSIPASMLNQKSKRAGIKDAIQPRAITLKCLRLVGPVPAGPFVQIGHACLVIDGGGPRGGRSRIRTYDPLIKSQLLYQLSYAPSGCALLSVQRGSGRIAMSGREEKAR